MDMLKSLVDIRNTFKDMSDTDRLNISRTIGYIFSDLQLDKKITYKQAKELGLGWLW